MKQKLFPLIGLLSILLSCQKQIDTSSEINIDPIGKKFNYNRFFPETDNPAIKRIFEHLKNENSKKDFLSDFVKVAGYPRWDKVLTKEAANMQNIMFANTIYQPSDIFRKQPVCQIP